MIEWSKVRTHATVDEMIKMIENTERDIGKSVWNPV